MVVLAQSALVNVLEKTTLRPASRIGANGCSGDLAMLEEMSW
jgi:hypothetical protein